ncbi:hypothetical protein A2U01_0070339, partial [Trifolium medium]|nr:hypothetical protein [Trifolium medium]
SWENALAQIKVANPGLEFSTEDDEEEEEQEEEDNGEEGHGESDG